MNVSWPVWYPRNSISNVVTSVTIHDGMYKYMYIFLRKRCSKKDMKPLWNIYVCAYTYTFTHLHLHMYMYIQIHKRQDEKGERRWKEKMKRERDLERDERKDDFF